MTNNILLLFFVAITEYTILNFHLIIKILSFFNYHMPSHSVSFVTHCTALIHHTLYSYWIIRTSRASASGLKRFYSTANIWELESHVISTPTLFWCFKTPHRYQISLPMLLTTCTPCTQSHFVTMNEGLWNSVFRSSQQCNSKAVSLTKSYFGISLP
jgi:hypothetical protein